MNPTQPQHRQRCSPLLAWIRWRLKTPVTALLLGCFVLWTTPASALTGYWNFDGAGNWSNSGNWLGGTIPNGVGDIANFNFNLGANRTITLDAPFTLGGLVIGDMLGAQAYTFAGPGVLTLDALGSAHAFINKYNSTTDVWQAPLSLNDALDANIFAGILDVTGAGSTQVAISSSASDIIKNNGGNLRLNLDATAFNGNWVVNQGTLTIGGANANTAGNLGNGTGGIILNGTGLAAAAVLSLNNNGTGSNGTLTYTGNNDVVLQGAATINADRNYISGSNTGNTIVLDNLTMNGGILGVTSANSYALRFNGTTSLVGDTNVFSVGNNSTVNLPNLTLGGVIDDGVKSRALIKEGTGRMVIANSANTYDGATVVKDGFLQIASGANLGTGKVFVNGGVLSLVAANQTGVATIPGGLNLVSQIGTTRAALPVIGNTGFTIDAVNPLNVSVPIYGMVIGVDGDIANNIDLSQIGGAGNTRVSVANVGGVNRTYTGTISPATDNTIRLNSAANIFIISGTNALGGATSTANITAGLDLATPLNFPGVNITQGNTGTISVRGNNSATLGNVTVNRGITVSIEGTGLTTPLGNGVITALGGTVTTDATTDAKFGNTDFRLYGGSTLFLDNSAVTATNTDRRLLNTSNIDLTSSTFRLRGDGGAATISSQSVNSIDYWGGSTISVDTDSTTAGRLTTLTTGSLNRQGTATLNIRNIGAQATTFGTAAATQKLLVTAAPTVTNGMIGANIAMWAGTASNDSGDTRFATYTANGIEAATFNLTPTTASALQGATATQIVDFNNVTGTITMTGNATMQALRLRTTANTQILNSGAFTITLGSAAAAGQGAGLQLEHTANNEVIHPINVAFGSQEGMIYTATTGGTSGIVTVSGVLSGTNGITRFGDGILRLTGANTFTGPLTINAGETRLNNVRAAGPITGTPNDINLWGGSLYFEAATQRYNNNVTFFNDARLGNINVANTGFNNLTVAARSGSTAPVVLDIRVNGGSNQTTAYGGLTLNGPAQIYATNLFQINGGISGAGRLEKFGNERLLIGGDSSGYSQTVTANTGVLSSIIATSTAKPFGTGAITLNPGGALRVAAPTNINASQLTMNSDLGGIASLGMSFVADPTSLPAMTVNSTAPWKGTLGISAVGFSQNINQSTLWGGGSYLGATLGDTGNFTGTLTPDGTTYRLGTGQGTIRIDSPLTGASNGVQIGLSMTGDVGRADQGVNNAGGTVQFDVPMTYGGATVLQTNGALRISATTATTGIGAITLNGGILQGDSLVSNFRGIAPLSIANTIELTADSTIQMQNNAGDFRLAGPVNLASGSTGVVRQLTVGIDGTNAGQLYLDGGISDGTGGSGNHLIKAGQGAAFIATPVSYTGTTNITGGFLAINSPTDLASSSQIVLSGGGVAIWENSMTLDRNVSIQSTANNTPGWFDVQAGLTLTQSTTRTIEGPQNSTFTNSGMLMKRGLGTMILNSSNAMTGVAALDGILQINNQAALGDPARVGASDIQIGGDFFIGGTTTVTRFTGGTLRINDNVVTSRGIQFNNNGSSVYGGGIDVTAGNNFAVTGVLSQGSEFDFWFKTGAGTLVTTGANTFRQFALAGGTYQFGTSTPWANSTGTNTETTTIEMIGGTLRAVNAGASIALTNNLSTTNYNYGGGMVLQMESGAGLSIDIQADALVRQNQGTLVLQTMNGTTLGAAGSTNAARLIPTNAVNSGLARASAMSNGIFAPHLITADSTGVANFVTDDATNGFKPYSGATLSSLAGSNPTSIADISGTQTLNGSNSIFALRTTADINGGTLRIRAIDNVNMGGILFNGSNTISSNLVFDPASATAPGTGTPGEGLVYVKEGENAAHSGTTLANALTKFGRGTLTLSGGGAVLGDVSIQDGTVKLGATNPFNRMNSELNLNSGATLDLNGNSIAVETLGSNNRQVTGTGGGVNFGGSITNAAGGSAATLSMAGPQSSTFTGTMNGNLKLMKAGSGVLTIDGYRASTPDSGGNTFSGGTNVYGVGTTGGLLIDNAPFAFGGANGSTPGDVNLYSGTLDFRYSGNATTFGVAGGTNGQQYNNLVVRIGADGTNGVTLNVKGPGLINVNQSTGAIGQGNIIQVGTLNMTDTSLSSSGGNLYRFRAAGPVNIQGAQATFNTTSAGPAGMIELAGLIGGNGSLNKLGDTVLGAVVISGNANTHSGGTNIIAGEVQVTATSGTPLGSGNVRVFPTGTLRLAGNGSVNGAKLEVMSSATALGAISLDQNFNPTVLTSANFSSVYNNTLQLSQPYWTQALNLATIGDGRSFLGTGLGQEVKYMAATLGTGAPEIATGSAGVYRLVGGSNNLAFDGVNNVLTGNSYLQIGPQRGNVVAAPTNGGNAVVIRNSNNFTAGTQITEGTTLAIETGGSPIGETPLGSGAVEVYGTLQISGNLGSAFNASTGSNANTITLRPGGQVRIIDATNLVAGDQGRWGDTVPVDLNGGIFRLDGAANYQTVETIGDVTARKGGTLTVIKNSTASSAQLNIASLARADRGTVSINYTAGFLGQNTSTPLSYERLIVNGGVAVGGTTTNGSGFTNTGMASPWIIDRVANTFVGYNTSTGFQPLISAAPGVGEVAYNKIASGALTAGGLVAGDIADLTTAAKTLADNPTLYALRTNQNISPTASNNTMTLTSGGLIMTAGTINPTGAITSGTVSPMTLNFGAGGAGEALIFVGAATSTIQAQIVAAQGLTKMGPNQLTLTSINPGIGAPVVINEGTLLARVPVTGGGSGAAVGTVFNGQDVILNGGGLQLASQLANATGTASEIASNATVTGSLGSNVFVRGDSTLGNNSATQYVRINNLTIANAAGAAAMNNNGVIALALQSGIWVGGTTSLTPQTRFNSTFNGMAQTTLAGLVTGNGGVLEKFGNGTITLLNGGALSNLYSGGTIIHGAAAATAASVVASGFRGTGSVFGTGEITINPGGVLRLADNVNIASNAVTMKSDDVGLAGIGIAHNGALPTIITSGSPTAGQIKLETTGTYGGAITLDYGYYSQPLNMAAVANGSLWLGNSQQADAYYFNQSLGANANAEYQLGAGGNQAHVYFGGVLMSAGRQSVFENVFSGGTANSTRIEIGALTGNLAAEGPSFVNGNTGGIGLLTRNLNLTGDVRVNTNSTINLGNNFALGNGRLVLNGGNVRYDAVQSTTIDNNVLLTGDFTTSNGNDFVINGNVAMHDAAYSVGATRLWNLAGTGTMGVYGVVSGADGSNLIKSGAQTLLLGGANTYQGYTQINNGEIIAQGNVLPNVAGPLGISDSPIVFGSGTGNTGGVANVGGWLGIGGKFSIGRDIILGQTTGTGSSALDARTNERVTISGGISLITASALTVGSMAASVTNFQGGTIDLAGPISGAGSLIIGTTTTTNNATTVANAGTVILSASANGFGINTFSGGVTLNSARLQIGSDTYFTNAANNPTILSGPLGTGTFTFGAGEANRGGTIEAVGGARTIVNALGNLATASNTTLGFSGVNALTFTRDLNLNSDATMRTRTFNVPNAWAPISFSGNLTNSGAGGSTLIKTGVGTLVLTGTNTQADLLTTDANYGAGVVVNAGILRVNADAALGSTTSIAAGGTHLVGPADIKLGGGTLSASAGFTTTRQLILTANSGVDVASGQSLTLSTATAGAFTITKTGPGTLALNNIANALTGLTLGGQSQQNPALGRYSNTGGTVSTMATSGAPFVAGATGTVTIHSGTLSLVGGASAQSLSVPRLIYGAAGHVALNQGTTTSTLTASEAAATAFQRAGTFNSVSFGTLALNTSIAGALGGNEKVLITNAAAQPANTAGAGGSILSVPSIVTAVIGSGQDADFVRYDATNGFMAHNVTTVTALGATAPTNVGDISAAGSTAGSGIIDVLALRTAGNITPTDGTSLVRILGGGLIMNGSTAPNISANVSFNNGSSAIEALTYVRDGQSGASILSGNIAARDFTKFGPGTLELSGTANVLTAGTARLPVLSVQEGTLRFANAGGLFQNGSRGNEAGLFTLNVNESGVFDTNGLALSIAGITGNGTILGGGALTSRNGFGVDLTFSGSITGTSSFTKSGDGILTMTGFSTYSGGTNVEAGRIVSAIPLPNTNTAPGLSLASLGTLDARGAQALGTGPITLKGGILAINNNIAHAEVEDGVDFNTFGPGNGYDITVANSGATNGIALPGNLTSTIYLNSSNTATLTGNSAINSLTIDAPQLNIAGLASNSGNLSLLFVKGAANFSQTNTVLDTNGGRLFLGGQVNASGKTITKIGVQDLVLTNTELGAGQNQAGLWKVYGGTLNPRVADGASNPLGSGVTVELNGGTTGVIHLNLSTDGNGTTLSERITTYQDTNVRFGSMLPVTSSEFVMSGASRINTDRVLGNNSNKTTVINNLEAGGVLGSPYVYFTGGNSDTFWVNGTTNFTRDLYLQNDVALTLNGVISGSGTLVKRFGTTTYVNADNTSGYNGGTIISGSALLFGSLEGNQITLNDTAKLGKGHVVVNANGQLQFNSATNLQAGQNVYVSSNLDNFGVLRLAANLTLDQVNFRAAGVGGAQATASNYYLTNTNPGGGVLALNTAYSNALNMRSLGDGTWFLGSTTNGVGANGSYDAATLAPGFNNTYRLGAGGATLFFGSNGASNVITNTDASCISNLVVGAPMSVQNNAVIGNGSGNVVFLTSQNYSGSTSINRSSTLDFRGTLNTSGIETYGSLNVAGETGTFLKGGTGANIPVTLRPGSTLRFDNTAAGVLPVASTQGRWEDSSGIDLDNATVRLQGNAAVEVSETVGPITAKGGSFIEVVRGVVGRGTELRTPGITRVGAGTITFNTTSETLGSDERIIVPGTAPVVTNGMVAPWMISNTNTEFITYNADTGFSKAGFTNVQAGGTTAATLNLANDRVLFGTAATVIGNGFDINAYAARLDQSITLATATNNTASANRLVLGSGGLIVTAAISVNAGIVAGAGSSELLVFNNNTLTVGDSANITTSGQIAASSITKSGAGTLALQAVQGTFTGNINVNQGALTLGYNPAGATGSVTVTPVVNVGGAGGTIFLNGPNVSLNLNGGNDAYATGVNTIFNNSVTIGDYNPIVQLVANRFGGNINGRRVVIGGNFTFGANTAETGQIARFTSGNAFDWQLGDSASDTVTLTGKSVFDVDNGGTAGQPDLTITAKVTGTGTLVKSRIDTSSDLMLIENVTNLNDFSGGTIVTGGTLRVYAKANNVAAAASTNITAGGIGTGTITLMGGTLDLRVDNDVGGAADTNAERTFFSSTGNGLDLIVNGSATLNVDRTGLVAAGTTKQITFNSLTIGSQILTVSGGNTYSAEIAGTTTLKGNLFLNNSVDMILGGDINDGGAGLFINKINTGVLWVNSATNTLGGGAFINAGMLRFGTPRGASTTAQLGSGLITINPDAEIRLEGTGITNINTAAGQKIDLISTAYAPAVLRTPALTQAQYQQILTPTSNGQLALLGTESNALDMSTLGDGRMYLGTVEADRTYNAATLDPGLADIGGTNRVYRLGTRNSGTLIVNLSGTGNLTDVGGMTDVRIGSLANLGPQGSWGVGLALFQDQNTYTGSTTIVRGSSLRFDQANTLTAGSLGALTGVTGTSAAAIHAYGILRVEGTNGSFVDTTNSANAYTNITLHPGSELRLQDINATGAAANRWHDSAPIALNGSLLTLQTANAVVTAAETVGAISFERGSRIQSVTQSTAQMTLSTPGITRTGTGTMMLIPSALNRLGAAPAVNSERILVTGTAPTNVAGTNMLPGYYGVQVENRFATYGANGFAPVADAQMVTYAAGLANTSIVNIQATTTLLDNPSIFALRIGAFTLNSITGANNDSTVTFADISGSMGGIITSGASTIHPNLKFGSSGTGEALINTVGGSLTFNGNLTAGSVTKFGANSLIVANDQSDAARGLGNGYSNGWVVNEGTLQLGTFGSAGNAAPGNMITLNGSQVGASQLNLRAQPQNTLLNYSYTSGKIIAVDNAVIDWDPGANDRVHTIADIEVQQAGGNGPVDAQLRFANNRARSILATGQLTLTNNAIINVDTTADQSVFYAYTTGNTNLTTGTSSGISVASLNGSGNFTKWGDGYMYVRGASPTFTGNVVIDEGAVQVNHNNALGSGPITVNRYGILDIAVANYTPTPTYNDASVERWSIDGARTGTVNLGLGTLQVAVNQSGSANVVLNGGSIEGWLRSDDVTENNRNSGVFRNLGPNIGITLAGNSLVGTQYYEGANGLDMGKQTNDSRPLEEYFGSGVILDIQGVISGAGKSLTKVGYDTVILSGANTYTGGTNVNGGKLVLGRNDALAATGDLNTNANGVLDLNGSNQTVAKLSNAVNPTTPSTNSGYITNSAASANTLTVGNGVTSDFTYSGVIQNNVAINKTGVATLQLDNANTYLGKTTVSAGTIKLGVNGAIDDSPWIEVSPTAMLDVTAKTGGYTYDGTISGGGTDAAGTTFVTVANSARIAGNITVGDHIGEVCIIGTMAPGGSSNADDITTAGNQIGHIYTSGALTLSGGLAGSSSIVPETRLTMQLNGSTTTLASLGYTSGSIESFIDGLSGTESELNGGAGNLSNHDYLNVGGALTLNANGLIVVSNFGSYTPNFGDVFNLLDWTSLSNNGFVTGTRYQTGSETNVDLDLPVLADASWQWDTSRFASLGVVVVVPEPGRFTLLFIGLASLLIRRRRRE